MIPARQQTSLSQRGRAAAAFFAIGCVVLAADRMLKWIALDSWSKNGQASDWGLHWTFLLNRGIAFSLPLSQWWFFALTVPLLCVLFVWAVALLRKRHWWETVALAFVLFGSISNVVDRVLYGGVVDYLQLINASVVNLADGLILAGILLFLGVRQRIPQPS